MIEKFYLTVMAAFFNFLILLVFIGFFLIALPTFFILLMFLESVLFSIKRIQNIRANSRYVRKYFETESSHHLMAKALAITCGSKRTEIPFYLVTAYLYIGQGEVYEIDPKSNRLLRIFSYNSEINRITITAKRGSLGNKNKDIVHQVYDLEPKTYQYLTYLPDGVKS